MEKHLRAILSALALGISLVGGGADAQAAGPKTPPHPCVYDTLMLTAPAGVCRPRAISYPKTVTTAVQKAIYDGALMFGVPYNLLKKIARCESGLNPKARGHGHYGLFQFAPATFKQGKALMAKNTGVVAHSYWKPRDASYVAAYLFAVGEAPDWSCTSQITP